MREQLKQRLVGAAVLVALGVIVIPEFLKPPAEPDARLEPSTRATSRVSGVVVIDERGDPGAVPQPVEPPAAAAPLAQSPRDTAMAPSGADPGSSLPQPGAGSAAEPALTSTRTWVVQLATFAKKRNARELQSKLRELGYPVFLESQAGQKGALTLVFVGPLGEKSEAQEALAQLEERFKLKGMVFQRKGG